VDVMKGDLVIIATDGLWDNITTDQILRIIKNEVSLNTRTNTKELAVKLVEAAYKSYVKPDDITAVVGIVREQNVYT
jgi:serine/threonine protein phosphatase PrpC